MKTGLFYAVTLWLLLWLQVLTHHASGGTWLSLPWTFIAVLFLGLVRGPFIGQLFGAILGLLLDASTMSLFGLNALLYAVAGFTSGMMRRQLDGTKPWTQMIFSGLASFIYASLFVALDQLFSHSPRPIGWVLGVQPTLQACLAPVVFQVMRQWVALWDAFPMEEV